MTEPLPPVLLVGCGKMGGAMLEGWLARGILRAAVIEPSSGPAKPFAGRAEIFPDPAALHPGFVPAAVILAIKPQEAAATLPAYTRFASGPGGGAVFVSIMAGQTTAAIGALLGGTGAVVRAMPNTPAAIGKGFTVATAARGVSAAQRGLADALLSATGEVAWTDSESHLDAVTAVSGGGPAYVFLLAELLETAAVEQGIPPDLARRMARATVAGSGALLAASEEDAAALRKAVTSPKGTTERALEVLTGNHGWPVLVSRAIAAATARSRELAG